MIKYLLLSISGWINSVKMNSSVIFISDNSLGNFLFCVSESSTYFGSFAQKIKSLTESIDSKKNLLKVHGYSSNLLVSTLWQLH